MTLHFVMVDYLLEWNVASNSLDLISLKKVFNTSPSVTSPQIYSFTSMLFLTEFRL